MRQAQGLTVPPVFAFSGGQDYGVVLSTAGCVRQGVDLVFSRQVQVSWQAERDSFLLDLEAFEKYALNEADLGKIGVRLYEVISRHFHVDSFRFLSVPYDVGHFSPDARVMYWTRICDGRAQVAGERTIGNSLTFGLLSQGGIRESGIIDGIISKEQILSLQRLGKIDGNITHIPESWLGVPIVGDSGYSLGAVVCERNKGESFLGSDREKLCLISSRLSGVLERKARHDQQMIQDMLLRKLAEQGNTGIAFLDHKGNIAVPNEVLITLLGESNQSEVTGRGLEEYIISLEDQSKYIAARSQVSTGIMQEIRVCIRVADNTEKIVCISLFLLRTDRKTLRCILMKDVTEEDEQEKMRLIDPGTGLYNKHYAPVEIERMARQMERRKETGVYVSMDLLNFKGINDIGSLGHVGGDKVLNLFGKFLQNSIRPEDAAFRMGGDEFGILLVNCDLEKAHAIMSRVQQNMEGYNREAAQMLGVTKLDIGFSFGLTEVPKLAPPSRGKQDSNDTKTGESSSVPQQQIERMLLIADKVMYINKGVHKGMKSLKEGSFESALDEGPAAKSGLREFGLAQKNYQDLCGIYGPDVLSVLSENSRQDVRDLDVGMRAARIGLVMSETYQKGDMITTRENIKELLEIRPDLDTMVRERFSLCFEEDLTFAQ